MQEWFYVNNDLD
jgi:hypothetical protein